MKLLEISLVLPAYNESENIEQSIRIANETLSKITDKYEIIVVNDGSKDLTGTIIDSLASENNKIKAIHHSGNKGYGDALWSGIVNARYDWLFFTDADLQFDLNQIEEFLGHINKYRVVLGYRSPRKDSLFRLFNAKCWNILIRILFGLKVKDIDCAFKLFDRKILSSLNPSTRGAMMNAEILIKLMRKGENWKEIPVKHFPRTKGVPTGAKIGVILRAFRELIKLYISEY